jgi:hypothetical protein
MRRVRIIARGPTLFRFSDSTIEFVWDEFDCLVHRRSRLCWMPERTCTPESLASGNG